MRESAPHMHIDSSSAEQDRYDRPLTIDLRDAAAFGCSLVGGKAMSLGVLMALDIEVPDGFVVTTEAFRKFAVAAGLSPLEDEEIESDPQRLASLGARVERSEIPEDVIHAIKERCETTFGADHPPLVVRSSGVNEDSATASFAGQFESVLNIRGLDSVASAIRRCWASQFRPSAAAYRKHYGTASGEIEEIAIVVQRLIDADVAGVLFTMDPLTGCEEHHVVEAVFGLGEVLVSGAVNADRYVVDVARGTARVASIAAKDSQLVPAPGGGVQRVSLLPEDASRSSLTADQLNQLTATGRRIQAHFGRPMDVEWVITEGRLHIVQARPITSIHFGRDVGLWTTADFRDGGVSSSVCSPFMWSLYQRAFQTALPRFMHRIRIRRDADRIEWTRLFFGRPYWNLGAVKDTLSRLPGYRERDFDEDLGIVPTYDGLGVSTPFSFAALARALPVLFSLPLCQRRCLAKIRRFAHGFGQRKSGFDLDSASLAAMDRTNFVSLYESLCGFQFETETTYFETIFNTSIAKLAFRSAIQSVEHTTGIQIDESTLLSGLLDLSHTQPWKDLYRIFTADSGSGSPPSDEVAAIFAQRWPQHGRKELDICAPRWPEDLDFVRMLMEQAFATFEKGQDPIAQERAQHERYQNECKRALAAIGHRPLTRWRFLVALRRIRCYAWWREEMRDYSSHLYALMRRWSLEAGRRLVEEGYLIDVEDVWALRCEDVVNAIRGTVSPGAIQAKAFDGRQMMASFRNFEAPGEIGERHPATQDRMRDSFASGRLYGTPCSSGGITARARIIADLDGADVLEEGEILVTKFTDPGWTLLFPKLAGVITETGGILSHAAVISREFGIPAVLGVVDATRHIRDGDQLAIDGASGTVEILERVALPTS